jgi:prolyl-tRNA synthetase
MFRLKDRKGADMCLGMTHEEVFTTIARNQLRSYKQLPQVWYQIQIKFRDEPRPKSGLMRLRTFIMKDAYSFDADREGLDRSFADQREAYKRIFTRCGLKFSIVEASSGSMGGSESSEFVAKTDAGEDLIANCENCGYAANLEKATSRLPRIEDEAGPAAPEEFLTPGVRTIKDLTTFVGGAKAERQIKTLALVATIGGKFQPVVALLRGDHDLQETKLIGAVGADRFRSANAHEIKNWFGANAGSLGAVNLKRGDRLGGFKISKYGDMSVEGLVEMFELEEADDLIIVADPSLEGRRNMTTGANKDNRHLRGVDTERDIKPDQWADLRAVQKGEACPRCDTGVLDVYKAMEIGHIFKLGTKYSESMGATFLTQDGKEAPIIMGSYGIGVERIITAAVEQNYDADGIIWPRSIAPFDIVVTVTNTKQDEMRSIAEKLYDDLRKTGLDVLLDDRDERAGVKFKDADLIGIPYRVTVGKKISDGMVELFDRSTKHSQDIKLDEVADRVQQLARAGV